MATSCADLGGPARDARRAATGPRAWDSALAFATAVSSSGDDDSVAGDRLGAMPATLELGSGCGLVALALACRGANVVATERAIALPLLEKNVARRNARCVDRGVDGRQRQKSHRARVGLDDAGRRRAQPRV